jgi:hypothetical protein
VSRAGAGIIKFGLYVQAHLLHLLEKLSNVYAGISQCALQGVAVNFVVERKDNYSSIGSSVAHVGHLCISGLFYH